MFRTKIRTTAIALAAAFSFAAAIPGISQAKPNNGNFSGSHGHPTKAVVCANYETLYNYDAGQAQKQEDAGNTNASIQADKNANQDKAAAQKLGCRWAA